MTDWQWRGLFFASVCALAGCEPIPGGWGDHYPDPPPERSAIAYAKLVLDAPPAGRCDVVIGATRYGCDMPEPGNDLGMDAERAVDARGACGGDERAFAVTLGCTPTCELR